MGDFYLAHLRWLEGELVRRMRETLVPWPVRLASVRP